MRIRDITVSNSHNPSRVYIRLCKDGKRFLLHCLIVSVGAFGVAFININYYSGYHLGIFVKK